MISKEELIELEKKYFIILKNTLSANLGKIISQICGQKLFENLAENFKKFRLEYMFYAYKIRFML